MEKKLFPKPELLQSRLTSSRPALFVDSAGGKETQERFFAELIERLEKISPGLATNI
jgi:hypothetical protein